MAVIITPQEEIDKYFESPAIGQSTLKKLLGGIDNFKNVSEEDLFYKEKKHFIIGSAVDILLTGETGEFEKQYYVSTIEKKPSEVEMSIINRTLSDVIINNFNSVVGILGIENYQEQIKNSVEEHEWQSNWKIQTRIDKIIDVGAIYFEDLKEGFGKKILSVDEKKLIDAIVYSLVNNSRTSKYFDRESISKLTDINFYYQSPIYFTYKNIPCKALFDILITTKDKEGKILSIQPFDLKTLNGNTLNFPYSLKKFRYDINIISNLYN